MIDQITPVLLTYNEASNLSRTLEPLFWAGDIVVVDSFSSDETPALAAKNPRIRFFQRKFDTHAAQWNFAVRQTGIRADWILALDADHVLSGDFIKELEGLDPNAVFSGYCARFIYCVNGRPLRASIYPPATLLYRPHKSSYIQDGHTQRIVVEGTIGKLKSPIFHDDRKPISRWFMAQKYYMKLEALKLTDQNKIKFNLSDRVRQWRIIAPPAVFLYCLFGKALILDGLRGIFYAIQRMIAECVLSFYLIRHDLRRMMRIK